MVGRDSPGLQQQRPRLRREPVREGWRCRVLRKLRDSDGKGAAELTNRTVRQYVGEGLYRFANDQLYVGARYNTVKGELAGITNDISVNRWQYGGGWFVTPLLLAKLEWVNQKYLDFPATDIRNGGQFKGFMVEGVLAF